MRGRTDTGKGSGMRPRTVSRELYELNFLLACGNIDRRAYDKELEKLCKNEKN